MFVQNSPSFVVVSPLAESSHSARFQVILSLKFARRALSVIAGALALLLTSAHPAQAADDSIFGKPAEQKQDVDGKILTLAPVPTPVVSPLPQDFHLEFSLNPSFSSYSSYNEDVEGISLTKRHDDESKIYLVRLLHKCMNEVEGFRLFKRSESRSSHQGFQPYLAAGYGHLSGEDDGTVVTRGDNGTRQEPPGFLYLRSSIQF
jgi:hypothetical protein